MREVFWLIPDQLAGRPGPEYRTWSLEELRANGFITVINLSETAPDRSLFFAAGIQAHWIPLPGPVPADSSAESACRSSLPIVYEAIAHSLSHNSPTLVHCFAGLDRTGLALAYFLARAQGLDASSAIATLRRAQPRALRTTGWEDMALSTISHLT